MQCQQHNSISTKSISGSPERMTGALRARPQLILSQHGQYIANFSVVFAVTLASRYFCFKYLDRVKRDIIHASDIAERLSINVFVVFYDISLG